VTRRRRLTGDPTAERAANPEDHRLGLERLLRKHLSPSELVVIRCVFGMNGQEPMTLQETAKQSDAEIQEIEFFWRSAMRTCGQENELRHRLREYLDVKFPHGVPDFTELDQEDWCPVHQLRIVKRWGTTNLRRCTYCTCWLPRRGKGAVGRPTTYCDDYCKKEYLAWRRRERASHRNSAPVKKFRPVPNPNGVLSQENA
jgi:hypothetical protein